MKRKYHHYNKWEDNKAGMYDFVAIDEQEKLNKATKLLKNVSELKKYMMIACRDWSISAEVNMTAVSNNRQAWLGQAACCLCSGAPAYITKMAWRSLKDEQRIAANNAADEVIHYWDITHEDQPQDERLPGF